MMFIRYVLFLMISYTAIVACHGRTSGTNGRAASGNDAASGADDPAAGTNDLAGGVHDPSSNVHDPSAQSASISDSLAQKAMSGYTGHLGDGLITMVINYISGDAVSGYTVQRGRRRNFNGDVHLQGGALQIQLEEAGDQPGRFSFHIDTADWKMSGRVLQGEESRLLNTAQLPEGWRNRDYDTWFPAHRLDSRDSVLVLKNDGLCEFRFYLRPWDSTSQLIRIRGNYERLVGEKEGYKVEWEENVYLKPVSETLVVKNGVLTGNGLRLERLAVP